MHHNRSTSTDSTSKRRVPLVVHSFRRVLDVSRFESPQHRRRRLEATRLNELAPVSSLPPELLCQIFLFHASSFPVQGNRGLGWLTVTHVIHRWREAALSCPELSANIIFRKNLVPIMLSRSKEVPLVIRVDLDTNKHLKPRHIWQNSARLGVLDVRGSQTALDIFFIDSVGKIAAPRLRSLSVVNTTMGDPLWLDAGVFHAADGRKSHMPRQLRMERCALPWNSPWYSNLTDLYLAYLHKAHGPTITMLLSVIVTSPLLEHLTLIDTKTQADGSERVFPFALRHLRTLHLIEPISVCAQILMNLTFPSIVTVVICSLPSPKDTETPSSLVHSVLCHRDFCQTYDFLRIEAPTAEHVRIATSSCSTDKTLVIDVHHGVRQLSLAPALHTLVKYSATFFSCITTLYVSTISLKIDAWRHLCKCRYLTTLTLRSGDLLPALTLLCARAMRCLGISKGAEAIVQADFDADGACNQLFPYLECITLSGIDCGDPKSAGPSVTDVLRALLWARRAGRCPIPRVRLEACENVFQQDLNYLRFLATDSFVWDGAGLNSKEKDDPGFPDIRSFSLNVFERMPFCIGPTF
ncbi:F-box domain-containing protein [Mycena venus]|uniref:F-box domain-containing protein n=1 Tax=Mycena venus TaxID=2733690 RepID=A0A8H6YCE0_9AGAR|nr:F-box domain-containing protein [Mycena venus]